LTSAHRSSWQDIRDTLQGRVLDRTYRPGDKLPRDEDIAEELGCARSTVQRAMQDLADAGVVERKRKGGTHVRPDPVTRAVLDIPITRVEVEAKGAVYGYQLVHQAREMTPLSVAASFGLSAPEEMLHVEALHLADQRAYVFEDRWVNLESCAEIEAVDLTRDSANEWLVRNKPYSRCDVRLYAVNADDRIAERMEAMPGAALLVIERTTWLGDVPITTVRSVTRPNYQLLTQKA
jgi:GntR family transcriptional regulator, histidine utilization repressor